MKTMFFNFLTIVIIILLWISASHADETILLSESFGTIGNKKKEGGVNFIIMNEKGEIYQKSVGIENIDKSGNSRNEQLELIDSSKKTIIDNISLEEGEKIVSSKWFGEIGKNSPYGVKLIIMDKNGEVFQKTIGMEKKDNVSRIRSDLSKIDSSKKKIIGNISLEEGEKIVSSEWFGKIGRNSPYGVKLIIMDKNGEVSQKTIGMEIKGNVSHARSNLSKIDSSKKKIIGNISLEEGEKIVSLKWFGKIGRNSPYGVKLIIMDKNGEVFQKTIGMEIKGNVSHSRSNLSKINPNEKKPIGTIDISQANGLSTECLINIRFKAIN